MSLFSKQLAASLIIFAGFGLATTAHATTILSDDFSATRAPGLGENGQVGGAIDAYFTTINNTNVDALSLPDNFGSLCSNATMTCIDLAGTPDGVGYPTDANNGSTMGVLQTLTDFAPGVYDIRFLLTGSKRGNDTYTEVTFGDYDHIFHLQSGDVRNVYVQAIVTGDGHLTIASLTGGNAGALVNSVEIATTPEPSSLALLGTGVVGLAGFARRKISRS